MRSRFWPYLLLLFCFSGCGKSLDHQLEESIRQLDNARLEKGSVEILNVEQKGDQAIAEVKIQTAMKLRKQGDQWHLEEIRLGDRRWEQADIILDAINARRTQDTRRNLNQIRDAIERYREEQGTVPEAADFVALIDLLNPRYLERVVRLDSWWQGFAYERLSAQRYDLRSAGQDGEFHTADDILPEGASG